MKPPKMLLAVSLVLLTIGDSTAIEHPSNPEKSETGSTDGPPSGGSTETYLPEDIVIEDEEPDPDPHPDLPDTSGINPQSIEVEVNGTQLKWHQLDLIDEDTGKRVSGDRTLAHYAVRIPLSSLADYLVVGENVIKYGASDNAGGSMEDTDKFFLTKRLLFAVRHPFARFLVGIRKRPTPPTPPDTTIVEMPPEWSNSRNARLAFTRGPDSEDRESSYQCIVTRLGPPEAESTGPQPCSSPKILSDLSEGAYDFVVWAVNTKGTKEGHAAGHRWTVDLTPPVFSGVTEATPSYYRSVKLSWKAPEYGMSYNVCTSPTQGGCATHFATTLESESNSDSVVVPGLRDGVRYYFVVRAVDRAGNRDKNEVEISAISTPMSPMDDTPEKRTAMKDLHAIHAFDNNQLLVVGTDGLILRSTDAGATWETQWTWTSMQSLHFPSAGQLGYLAGWEGVVLKTTDGGQKWTSLGTGIKNHLFSIRFAEDGMTGYAFGADGTIIKTSDGADAWVKQNSGTTKTLLSGDVSADGRIAIVVGYDGTVLRTSDGGNTWENVSTHRSNHLLCVQLSRDGSIGVAGGWEGAILRTEDGGRTWRSAAGVIPGDVSAIHFPGGQLDTGYAAGRDGMVLKTTDGGATWEKSTSGVRYPLSSVSFPAGGPTGYIAGDQGRILRTKDGGASWDTLR